MARGRSTDRLSRSEIVLRAVFVAGDGDERNTVPIERIVETTRMGREMLLRTLERLAAAGLLLRVMDGVRITAAGVLALNDRETKRGAS